MPTLLDHIWNAGKAVFTDSEEDKRRRREAEELGRQRSLEEQFSRVYGRDVKYEEIPTNQEDIDRILLGGITKPEDRPGEVEARAVRVTDVREFREEASTALQQARAVRLRQPLVSPTSRRGTLVLSFKRRTQDELLDPEFDIERAYGGQYRALSKALAPAYKTPKELDKAIKEHIVVSRLPGRLKLHAQKEMWITDVSKEGIYSHLSKSYSNGQRMLEIADVYIAWWRGHMSLEKAEALAALHEGKLERNIPNGTVADWLGSGVRLLPMMLDTSGSGLQASYKTGLAGAVAGAVLALKAGQAGPQVLTFEEPVTVLAGAVGGFAVGAKPGFALGSGIRGGEIEAGLWIHEMLKLRDAQGNRVPIDIIKRLAWGVMVINGGMESLQLSKVLKLIPGAKRVLPTVLGKAGPKTMQWLLKNRIVETALARGAVKYGTFLATETGTEVLQKVTTLWAERWAIEISNELAKTDLPVKDMRRIRDELILEAKEAFKGFTVLGAPGTIVNVVGKSVQAIELAPKKKEGIAPPVTRITKLYPEGSEIIAARVDISEMGAGDAPIPMPVRKSAARMRRMARELSVDVSDIKGKGAADRIAARIEGVQGPPRPRKIAAPDPTPLTPEEVDAFRAAEAADVPAVVKPKLYIGNVTARMKRIFGKALGVDPNRILGYMDDGWSTKRTAISLTRNEAYEYLLHLETTLNDRLDNNQIRTHNDMARANADWGDIKTLRKVLDLPTITRPFTILKEQKTEVITIENLRERITKAVQPSKAAMVTTTQIDRLNVLMRKVAQATERGHKLGKQEQKQIYAEMQYLKQQMIKRRGLIDNIKSSLGKKINPFYRAAIESLVDAIDFETDSAQKQAAKTKLRDLMANDPEKAIDIPQELIDATEKKDIASLSIGELWTIQGEIQRLRDLGRLKSELLKAQRDRAFEAILQDIKANVEKAKSGFTPSFVQMLGFTPHRVMDLIDGGQNFQGEMHDMYVDAPSANTEAEQNNIRMRNKRMKSRMVELGFTIEDIYRHRLVGDHKLTVIEAISIYAKFLNPSCRLAAMYGGFVPSLDKNGDILLVTQEIHDQAVETLSDVEKLLGDTIIQEYSEHWPRIRRAEILANNRDPMQEPNYTPITRETVEHKRGDLEIRADFDERRSYRKKGIHRGFTIPREMIPPEYQTPISMDIMKEWVRHVPMQEHFANHAVHIKDMYAVLNDKKFKDALIAKFGKHIHTAVKNSVDTIANPNHYLTGKALEHYVKVTRRHVAVAYLAFNLTVFLKQVPSALLYWAHSSIGDMLAATAQFIVRPRLAYQNATTVNPQIADQTIDREIAELREADSGKYNTIVNKVGTAGTYPIVMIDRMVKTIGVNAMYTKFTRDNMSPQAAAKKATQITLREQPGFNPKDRAAVYSQSEFLNLTLMFTNQLNKLFNIGIYDIPAAFRQQRYADGVRQVIALGVMAILIRIISTGEAPEDPADAAKALAEQAIASVPIVGTSAAGVMKGYGPSVPAPLQQAGKVAGVFLSDSVEEALPKLLEPAAIIIGVPYAGPKKLIKLVKE